MAGVQPLHIWTRFYPFLAFSRMLFQKSFLLTPASSDFLSLLDEFPSPYEQKFLPSFFFFLYIAGIGLGADHHIERQTDGLPSRHARQHPRACNTCLVDTPVGQGVLSCACHAQASPRLPGPRSWAAWAAAAGSAHIPQGLGSALRQDGACWCTSEL